MWAAADGRRPSASPHAVVGATGCSPTVVVRQNPTATVDGARGGAAADVPNVHVVQAPDGRMSIDYNAHDAYEFPPATAADVLRERRSMGASP